MRILILTLLLAFVSCDKKGNGGGTIYTNLCENHPTNCQEIPDDQQRGGPVIGDDVIPPYVPPLSNYDHNDIQAMVNGASSGDTILIDRDVNIRASILVNKPLTIKKDPSVSGNITLYLDGVAAGFLIGSNNVAFEDFIVEMENSVGFSGASIDGLGNYNVNNIIIKNLLVKVFGVSRFGVRGNGILIENTTIVGYSDISLDFFLTDLDGDNLSIRGSMILDKNRAYRGIINYQNRTGLTINSSVLVGHAEAEYSIIKAFRATNVVIENNILQDSNTNRVNVVNDPTDEFDNSNVLDFLEITNLTDNGNANKYAAYRFYVSDLGESPPGSTGVVLGSQTQIPLFNFSDILEDDLSINCGVNPATYTSNTFTNLRQIDATRYIPGSNLLPDDC